MNNVTVLTDATIREMAPSVFAATPHTRVSDRYSLIPTSHVLNALRDNGWLPTKAEETPVRVDGRRGYAKHLLRLRHVDDIGTIATVGGIVPEIVLINSHDGSSTYQLHAGFYRFVCSNGLIVSDATLSKTVIRHSGDVVNRVIEGVAQIVDEFPRVTSRVRSYQAIQVDEEEATVFANAALRLRYPDAENPPVSAARILQPLRYGDAGKDVWTRFNVVQEHIMRGGLRTHTSRGRRSRTRAIGSINENVRLNKALWYLADEFAKLKTESSNLGISANMLVPMVLADTATQ